MPQERPRYEPRKIEEEGPNKGEYEFQESYNRAEERLGEFLIKNTEQPKPWKTPSVRGVVEHLQEMLLDTGKILKGQFHVDKFLEQPDAEAWKTRGAKCGGDLGGYFEDWKFEIATRPIRWESPSLDKAMKELVDLLGIAEIQGGLGRWLDQWYDAVRARDWDQMALVANAVGDGIAFNKALLDNFLAQFTGSDVVKQELKQEIQELRSVLNTMAFEVNRHIDKVITGALQPGDVAGRADAIMDALERNSDRARKTAEVRASVDALNASRQAPELSTKLDADMEVTKRLGNARDILANWDIAAADMSDLITSINAGADPTREDQMNAVNALKRVGDLNDPVWYLLQLVPVTQKRAGFNVFSKDDILFAFRQIAAEIWRKHYEFAQQLTDSEARTALLTGIATNSSLLQQIVRWIDSTRSEVPGGTVYKKAEEAAAKNKLDDFWSGFQVDLYGGLRSWEATLESPDDELEKNTAIAVRQGLETLFSDDLGKVLATWSKRKNDDIYGLAWVLLASLRAKKFEAERICRVLPNARAHFRDYVRQALDALIATVANELESDISNNRV